MSSISSYIMVVIIVLAVLFFMFGVLHLLIKYLIKRSVFSSMAQSNRYEDSLGSQSLQRQLHQLFRLHDSGLDQSVIDSLPVFYYKEIVGSKEPFDCAVCLCEFSGSDLLRLLPLCCHAFHMNCIDTWMLSNSTCPLCRQVISSGIAVDDPLCNLDELRDQLNVLSRNSAIEVSQIDGNEVVEGVEMRLLSVRLGKFRSLNVGEIRELDDQGETSSSINLETRRCYSMGTFQYVVGESELQVALSSNDIGAGSFRFVKTGHDQGANNNTDREAKQISARTRKGDSLSVSKIWLWSKRSKFPSLVDTNRGLTPLDIV